MVEGVARTPDVSMLVEFDRDIAWPTMRLQSQVLAGAAHLRSPKCLTRLDCLRGCTKMPLIAALLTERSTPKADDAAACRTKRDNSGKLKRSATA